MTLDARNVPQDSVLDCDICIVGGGAAGISLAREFIGKPYQVFLLESGGLDKADAKTESLREGDNIGLPYFATKDLTRRGLGGNTSRWSNWVAPFDDIDFEKRDWVPYSGWPFGKEALMPYYGRANQICGIKDFNYNPQSLAQKIGDPDFQTISFPDQRMETKIWRYHLPPLDWKDAYFKELEKSNNIKTYLWANVVEIEANEAAKQVKRIKIACVNDNQFWIAARVFVLAMGGIEIPRILLASNQVQKTGLGNQNDLVGRFFMEHPHYLGAAALMIINPEDYPAFYAWESMTQNKVMAGFAPTPAFQKKARILNCAAPTLNATDPWASAELADGFLEHVSAVLTDLGTFTDRSWRNKWFRKWFGLRTYRRLLLDVRSQFEQAPNPDSRVLLSSEKDRLGLNRIQLDWQLTPLDRYSLHQFNQLLAEEMGRINLGRVKILYSSNDTPWPPQWKNPEGTTIFGAWHFMGTTRMHVDPKQGVVDENCKVHGLSNLFIASSSVFPTVSFANPTLTIIALTLRLAEHINTEFSSI